jgi:hypothetical protein
MGRSPFLHYVISAMADNSGVDGPNLARLQGLAASSARFECDVHC